MKTCVRCGVGFIGPACKPCKKQRDAIWRDENRHKIRKWALENTDKRKLATKKWRAENSEKVKATAARFRAKHHAQVITESAAWRAKNHERSKYLVRRWYAENPVRAKAIARAWALSNPDKKRATAWKYMDANRETVYASNKAWVRDNPVKVAAQGARRRSEKLKATPTWADKQRMEACYYTAHMLGMHTGEWYHVDHVIPLRGRRVCGLHCEQNLQVMLGVDNCKKGNSYL